MGFRFVRIGNKSNLGGVKSSSIKRSLSGSMIIIYIMALLTVIVALKCLGYDTPDWLAVVISVMVTLCVGMVDKQLPRRRWRTLTFLLLMMAATFAGFGVYRFIVQQKPLEADAWIMGILLLISLGYGLYCLWRWRGCVRVYRDIMMQREFRSRRRRKTIY